MKLKYDENPWHFKGEAYEGPAKDDAAFVYVITDLENGKKYVGKKQFWSKRKLKSTDKRRTTIESDWKQYYSSSDTLKAIAKENPKRLYREIIAVCKHLRHASYLEVKLQFAYGVLESDAWYNDNIAGKWFPSLYNDMAEKVDADPSLLSS